MGDHIREDHDGQEWDFRMKMVSKHTEPLQRQCTEGLLIHNYNEVKLRSRRKEWSKNLPPDFGILEDQIYRVERKRVEIAPVCSDKSTKRVKVEKCVSNNEVWMEQTMKCNEGSESSVTVAENLTMHEVSPTQQAILSPIKADSDIDFMKSNKLNSDLTSDVLKHNLCGKGQIQVKIANGNRGLISSFLKISNRHIGAEVGSPKTCVNPNEQSSTDATRD